ncbi:polyprenyl synthetase family protein [Ferrimicrobium acidiphilum]|uniref:Heptaprenyl diphosphate synthase component 2 n=1 Tax=Ferrimicrobium acidiphilum DSM 19497 TaxID=1121877 RepID=A0A0D8FXI8_9ACTN|nr:polyprenyl synthetase family protein [Ferrimicrobium acidiphilum]KJE76987.1 heptaprenyl diphosphate synthase component 2 [Ferrimicrobium acidiphilum DSM 19497]
MSRSLVLLEEQLREVATTGDPMISEAATHLIAAGGKRVRPMISFAVAHALGWSPEKIASFSDSAMVQGAVAVELVHLASLYHDDVMDEASERRGVPSVNLKFGNLIAIVTGDFLLAKAAGISARLSQEIATLLADTLARMCEGQILEVAAAHRLDRNRAEYLAAISGKTASLMAASARIPALIAGLGDDEVTMFTEIGESIGMVFQIRDDIMDIFAPKEVLKKEPGQDLVEGIYTLPVILLLADPTAGKTLSQLLPHASTSRNLRQIAELLRSSGALGESLAAMEQYRDRVTKLVAQLDHYDFSWVINLLAQLIDSAHVAVGQGTGFLRLAT